MKLNRRHEGRNELKMGIRNTMLYRRFRYIKKRNNIEVHRFFRFIVTIIIFIIGVKYAGNTILPYMSDVSEHKTKAAVGILINDVVKKTFSKEGAYNELVTIDKNDRGEIVSIMTNTTKANILSSNITADIQKKLNSQNKLYINVPIGSLLGKTILYNSGPNIYFAIRQNGSINTEFVSEFSEAGINQTKHRILLLVKTNVMVKTAFIKNNYTITTTIPIAETIIVGKVPAIMR